MALPTPPPLAIGGNSLTATLPEAVRQLLDLRTKADSLLSSPALEAELAEGVQSHQSHACRAALEKTIQQGHDWPPPSARLSPEDQARGHFVLGWALGRVGEYDGTSQAELPAVLERALVEYATAAQLLNLPQAPELDSVPSVTRPKPGQTLQSTLAEQPAWVGEFLAEWARTQTTLAFSQLLLHDNLIDETLLADLLDQAARSNVQALFTPVDPATTGEDDSYESASTVMGNARLIKDMSDMYPFTSSAALWNRRIGWATHVADVRFVESSMAAQRLVDAASAAASTLQSTTVSPQIRQEVRGVLEATVRRLVPFEKAQGSCLLGLGRTMLDAVGALYLGQESSSRKRGGDVEDMDEEEADEAHVDVPENELVRETRQVLIRAAGLFENAYASWLRTPEKARTARQEQRLLRKLESTYIELEKLDNGVEEVVQLRAERVERALWIDDRLQKLSGQGLDEDSESDSDEEPDSDEEDLSKRMSRQARV